MGQYRTWYDSHCFLELIHMMSSNTKEDWESWDIQSSSMTTMCTENGFW